jgi:hypothetical protein
MTAVGRSVVASLASAVCVAFGSAAFVSILGPPLRSITGGAFPDPFSNYFLIRILLGLVYGFDVFFALLVYPFLYLIVSLHQRGMLIAQGIIFFLGAIVPLSFVGIDSHGWNLLRSLLAPPFVFAFGHMLGFALVYIPLRRNLDRGGLSGAIRSLRRE